MLLFACLAAIRMTERLHEDSDLFQALYQILGIINSMVDEKYKFSEFLRLVLPDAMPDEFQSIINLLKRLVVDLGDMSFNEFFIDLTETENLDYLYDTFNMMREDALLKDNNIYDDFMASKKGVLQGFDISDGFMKALNLDSEKIRRGILYIYDHSTTITMGEAFNQLDTNLHDIFLIIDKLTNLFKRGSYYSLRQFAIDMLFRPPSTSIDDFYKSAKTLLIEDKFTLKSLEKFIFTGIKIVCNIVQSALNLLFEMIGKTLGQFEKVFDLQSRNLQIRVKDAVESMDRLIDFDPDSKEYKIIRQALLQFGIYGINARELFEGSDKFDVFAKIFADLANPKMSLFEVFADSFYFLDIGQVNNFILNVTKVLLDETGKFMTINQSISELPRYFMGFEIKSDISNYFQSIIKYIPDELYNKEIADWSYSPIDPYTLASLIDSMLINSQNIVENLDKSVCQAFGIKENEFVQACKSIAINAKGEQDVFETLTSILIASEFASDTNCSYFSQTLKTTIVSISTVFSKLNDYSAFPFSLIFKPFSEYNKKIADMFSKDTVRLNELIELFAPKYKVLLDVIYKTFNGINSDIKMLDFLKRFPTEFLDIIPTIDNLNDIHKNNVTGMNIKLPQLSDAFIIRKSLDITFEDLFPIKRLTYAGKTLISTKLEDLTTRRFLNALQVEPEVFKSKVSALKSALLSENISVANIINIFSQYNLSKSLNTISNLSEKALKDIYLYPSDIETLFNNIIEDAHQNSHDQPVTPKSFPTGIVVGVIATVILTIIVATIVIVVLKRRKRPEHTTELSFALNS